MDLKIWLRIGDFAEYESFDDLDSATDTLDDLNIGPVLGWFDSGPGVGFQAPGYTGHNFVSLFWGDSEGNLVTPLSSFERETVERTLATIED
jgi:hypothetical protein